LRLLRCLDRSVLETARDVDLRPMELYALLLLSDAPEGEAVTTRSLSELLAARRSRSPCGWPPAATSSEAAHTAARS
jgi:hypothetical protein